MQTFIVTFSTVLCFFVGSCERVSSLKNQNTSPPGDSASYTPPNNTAQNNAKQEAANTKCANNGERFYWEGIRLRGEGKFEEAIERFKQSAANDCKVIEAYHRIAEIYRVLKRYEDQETYLLKILERDSQEDKAHWALARLYIFDMKKYKEGLKEAEIVKETDKSNLNYVWENWIGRADDGLKDYESAVKHYKIFLKGVSNSPDSYDYKYTKKRINELEKALKDKNVVVPELAPTPKDPYEHPW